MIIFNIKEFMKEYKLQDDTMKESELKKNYLYLMYPRHSKKCSDRRFVNIDNGSMGGTLWTAFYVKIRKLIYFVSFGGQPDKFLLNQLPKLIIFHN